MSWIKRWKGKYVNVDEKHPQGVGVCDDSDFVFNHKDLCKQMDWRGNQLVWTGLMIGRPYLDVPNEQNRPPIVKIDPKPFKNPRFPTPYVDPLANTAPSYQEAIAELEKVRFDE